MPTERGPASPWTFLTNHTHVLVAITRDPGATMRSIAEQVGVTERAVQRIVGELEADGYLQHRRQGRRNVYTVSGGQALRHPLELETGLDQLLSLLTRTEARPRPASVDPR